MAQTEYLTKAKSEKTSNKVFLANGTMLTGKVIDFDDEVIILDKCLIYKEKIISIVPQ